MLTGFNFITFGANRAIMKIKTQNMRLITVIACFMPLLSHALSQPTFELIPTTPTRLDIPINSTATVSYTLTNQTKLTRTLTMRPITGIAQDTSSGHCTSPMELEPHASCLLSLTIDGSQIAQHISSGPEICRTTGPDNNTPDPFLCSQPSQTNSLNITRAAPNNFAYIAQGQSQPGAISVCSVLSNSNFDECSLYTSSLFSSPNDIALNKKGTRAYVLTSNAVFNCEVDSFTGQIQTCAQENNPSGVNLTNGGLNPEGNFLYLTSSPSSLIYICPIMPDGHLDTCSTSHGNNTFAGPSGRVAFNPAGTYAYVANSGSGTVSICNIDTSTGIFSTCTTSNGFGTFGVPLGVSLNDVGPRLYVANVTLSGARMISVCSLNTVDGTLVDCTISNGNGTFNFDEVVNLFASNNSYLYVPNEVNNTISKCPMIANTLGTCTVINRDTIQTPYSVWLTT
jgi:6-phosphogluconolactonase (cycloisomerase 2 family)